MTEPKPGLFDELKRRNVFRVAAMYAVVGWLLLQIGEVTFEPLEMPEGSLRALILVVVLGFPVAVLLGWIYDWTPQGLVRTPDDPAAEVVRLRRGRRTDYAIIGALAAALGLSFWNSGSDPGEPTRVESGPTQFWERPAIAVLPFSTVGGDPAQAYFAEGLSHEISSRLAGSRTFPVIAHSSALIYRDAARNLQEVSAKLGARYVVDGSVRRVGEATRINVALIDGQSGVQLWRHAEKVDAEGVTRVSDDVAQAIVMAIDRRLWSEESERAAARPPANAWDLYMQAEWASNRFDYAEALALFERSMKADPVWGLPPAAMANTLAIWRMNKPATAPPDALERAMALAERAMNLAPQEWYAYQSLGIASFQRDPARARKALLNSIELNPNDFFARIWVGLAHILEGEFEEAIRQVEHALRIAPHQNFALYVLAAAHHFAGRPEDARTPAEQLIANGNNAPRDHVLMAVIYSELAQIEKAADAVAQARAHRDYTPGSLVQNVPAAQRTRWDSALAKAGWDMATENPDAATSAAGGTP